MSTISTTTVRDARAYRYRYKRCPSGQTIRVNEVDVRRFEAYHLHGPLTTQFAHHFTKDACKSIDAAKRRHKQLFHECDKDGHFYLDRPPQQSQAANELANVLVHDINDRSRALLKQRGLFQDHTPPRSNFWVHDFMRACITASLHIPTLSDPAFAYTPHHDWVKRAGGALACEIDYTTPKGVPKKGELVPDAIASIEYRNTGGHIIFMIEADRATETSDTNNFSRKSYVRSYLMYRRFIASNQYKRHFNIAGNAPPIVLNVTTSLTNMRLWMKSVQKYAPNGKDKHHLFTTLPDFGFISEDTGMKTFRPPTQIFDLWTRPWHRVGYPDVCLNRL